MKKHCASITASPKYKENIMKKFEGIHNTKVFSLVFSWLHIDTRLHYL